MTQVSSYLAAPSGRRPNVAIFLSGSGSNATRILELHRRRRGEEFHVAALVTDRPDTSKAGRLGEEFDVPVVALDIRRFYRERNVNRITIATEDGRRVREEWTNELRARLADYAIDFGAFAGFVPLTNLAGDFPCLNVHPGDLTYEKDGARHLVGLHTIPVERAILEGLDYMRSSVIIVEPYEGAGDNMDAGPILGVSPKVAIDLQGHTLDELQVVAAKRPARRPVGGYKDLLEMIADHNQDLLKEGGDWVVFPQVVFAFAAGKFGHAGDQLYYRNGDWQPVKTVEFSETRATPIKSSGPA